MQQTFPAKLHTGHDNFFRGRLLILDSDSIASTVDEMEKEAKHIRSDTLNICWHMRGGIGYTEAMHLSPSEREIIGEMVKEHLETTKKSGMPYF